MDYGTYHIAELLPQALEDLAAAAGTALARPDDRPPQAPPVHRPAVRPSRRLVHDADLPPALD
jgi:hypothetical protein